MELFIGLHLTENSTPEFEGCELFRLEDVLNNLLLSGAVGDELRRSVEGARRGVRVLETSSVGNDSRKEKCCNIFIPETLS